jgi:hypothetical protein
MDRSFARIYAGKEKAEKVKKWEKDHESNKCNDMDAFKSEYLDLLKHSYIPDFLEYSKDPAKFADGSTGIVLMQKLNGLLQQLEHVGQYASDSVKSQLQSMVSQFWRLGKVWEQANLKNLRGNPSTIFEDTERQIKLYRGIAAESQFRTYVVS